MESSGLRSAVNRSQDALRTELWPLPALGVGLAVLFGVLLPELDSRIDDNLPDWATTYLFGGGAGAARTVLDAVASSLITVTSLTFSLTVVTLQLASSQFSPRLLRTFTRDRFVHVTLAIFLATFTYALTVLRVVRTEEAEQAAFVPQISVTVAFVLALTSVLGLVLFLAHLAREIRVETMLRNVHTDASHVLTAQARAAGGKQERPTPPSTAVSLTAPSSGFLVHVDERALVAAATEADAVVVVNRRPGSSLVKGIPIGCCWPRSMTRFTPEAETRLRDAVQASVLTGFERTASQDIGFGLRQLTDVAVKALSPGVNDPTTAVHALGHSSALLCEMALHDLGPRILCDHDDVVRVVLERPDLKDLLEVATSQPRRYGAADPAVLNRLADLLRELAWTVTDGDQRAVVRHELHRLRDVVDVQDFDDRDNAQLHETIARAEQALTGEWPRGT